MQTYDVRLESKVSDSYRCTRAANSLDIDTNKKSIHELHINADIKTDFNVGLIIGASGSGKTTLTKHIFGDDCFKTNIDFSKPIIDQLPKDWNYDQCVSALSGVGLTAVPCWIRPAYTLSNGQRARAEAVLAMNREDDIILIDEWTSVVDRTVGKVMSHCINKYAKKQNKKIILCSCHYDVIEWLKPDWIIDCNKQLFENRRSLRQERQKKLKFDIKPVDRSTWKYFSKYHYLSERLPGGRIYTFGLFDGLNQIGFQCFANYVPIKKNTNPIYHFNRTVIHPDYAGMGLGVELINETSKYMKRKYRYKIMAKFSSVPVYKSLMKSKKWKLVDILRDLKPSSGGSSYNKNFQRIKVKTYSFEFVG